MAPAEAIVARLRGRGIELDRDGAWIIARPKQRLTDSDRQLIREHKAELLALVNVRIAEQYAELDRERFERDRAIGRGPMPLRRCGALVCRTCFAHSPSPHRDDCAFPRFEPCRCRWFWLSPHAAIKCVACAAPASLELVEAWVLARETGEGDDGWRIPGEILSMLHVETPPQ